MQNTSQPTGQIESELIALAGGGEVEQVRQRVRSLSQTGYIRVLRTVQTVEKALSDYVVSWQNACYWGNGTPFPDEEEEEVKAAAA